MNNLVSVDKRIDEQNKLQYFEITKYHNPAVLTDNYLKSLQVAKEQDVDVLMGAELLGTPELCEPDEFGFNLRFRDNDNRAPYLIVTPSLWKDGGNYISVYLRSGKLIGNQYKQNAYEYKTDGKRYREGLKYSPREILLIHVPKWGRIAFPICVDYLVVPYRECLARELKLNLMLCPSYSFGTVQFVNSICSVREFGTRLVWLNSCSALKAHCDKAESVGMVSVPVMSVESFDDAAIKICTKCNGECFDGCLFTVSIQLRNHEGKHCNEVKVEHILPKQ